MKIGILLTGYKKQEGGAYSYYNALVEGISKYHFDDTLEFVFVTIDGEIDPSAPEKSYLFEPGKTVKQKHFLLSFLNNIAKTKGINYLPISSKIQASFQKKYAEEIRLKLIEHNIDIIYSLTPFYTDLDYPTVVTHWDVGHKSTYVFPELIFNYEYESRNAYYKNILQKSFSIFCESEAGKKELCHYENINPDRVRVIPLFSGNIIDLDISVEQQQEILTKFSLLKNNFFIYPAQFWPHKNHFNLVLAFKIFNEKYPGTKLILAGSDKGNIDYIKNLVTELGLTNSVLFPGFISDAELFTFYKNAIAMVMPTLLGPTNMPPIEAHALGCRIICSDFEGHRESLGDNAIYIDPLDKTAIFSALEKHYVDRDVTLPDSLPVVTISDALSKINDAFLDLAAIRNTYPTRLDSFKIFVAIWISSIHII